MTRIRVSYLVLTNNGCQGSVLNIDAIALRLLQSRSNTRSATFSKSLPSRGTNPLWKSPPPFESGSFLNTSYSRRTCASCLISDFLVRAIHHCKWGWFRRAYDPLRLFSKASQGLLWTLRHCPFQCLDVSTTTKETHTSTGYQAVVEPPLIIYNPKIFPPTKFSVAKNLKLVSGYNIIERKKITMGAGRGSSSQDL